MVKNSDIDISGMLAVYKSYFVTKRFLWVIFSIIGISLFYISLHNIEQIQKDYPNLSVLSIPFYLIGTGAFIVALQLIFKPIWGFIILPILSAIFRELGKWADSSSKNTTKDDF